MIQEVANGQTDPLAIISMKAEAIEERRDRSQYEWGRGEVEQGQGCWGAETWEKDEDDGL